MMIVWLLVLLIRFVCAENPKIETNTIPEMGRVIFDRFFLGTENLYVHEGKEWKPVLKNIKDYVINDEKSRVYAIDGDSKVHYADLTGGGEIKFESLSIPSGTRSVELDFHPKKKDYLILIGSAADCKEKNCRSAFVTRDHKNWKQIHEKVLKCVWTFDEHFFPPGKEDSVYCLDEDRVFYAIDSTNQKTERIYQDVIDFYAVEGVLVFVVTQKEETLFFSSTDGVHVDEAQFPANHYIPKDSYTVLQSEGTAILVDISVESKGEFNRGDLYLSTTDAKRFMRISRDTNREMGGHVDFERPQVLRNVFFLNRVMNPGTMDHKQKATFVTFDNGVTFKRIEAPSANLDGEKPCDGCFLNLDLSSQTPPFSSEAYPGLLLAYGRVDTFLHQPNGVFMSVDGGLSFKQILRGNMWRWAFGQVLVFADETRVKYWDGAKLVDIDSIKADAISDVYNTSSAIIVQGFNKDQSKQTVLYSLEFPEFKPCIVADFEEWTTPNPCYLGTKRTYFRKKKVCIGALPDWKEEKCQCLAGDFECAPGFWLVQGKCVLLNVDPEQPKQCKGKYTGKSGYVKKKHSQCHEGVDLTSPVERDCDGFDQSPGDVYMTWHKMDNALADYFYFSQGRTIVMSDDAGRVFVSHNQGLVWRRLLEGDAVSSLVLDPYRSKTNAFLIRPGKRQFFTTDAFESIQEMSVPVEPTNGQPIASHPTESATLLWTGNSQAFISKDFGKTWETLRDNVQRCIFGTTDKFAGNGVFCAVAKHGRATKQFELLHSVDGKRWETVYDNVVGFATFEEYLVAAVYNQRENKLKLAVTVDGKTWAEARFPSDFEITDNGYTVLESKTGAIFLDAFVNNKKGSEFGTLLISNYNGTYFRHSLRDTNRDTSGFVDFEKMQGVSGIALANQVINAQSVKVGGAKEVRSLITYDNGESWKPIPKPQKGLDGKPYTSCTGDKCSLHLHSFTERHDPRDMFSTSTAPGMMVGVGNVGESLKSYIEGDTFLTIDAGRSWIPITKDAHMIELGDYGTIIILVNDEEPTDLIKYSLDGGVSFKDLSLSPVLGKDKIRVSNIVTEPQGTDSRFIIYGLIVGSKYVALYLDFSKVWSRDCVLNEKDAEASDFETWSPGETEDSCVFGQKVQYYRRKRDRACKVNKDFAEITKVVKPCECTRKDYECDFDYVPTEDGKKCVLAPGLSKPPQPKCVNGYYKQNTGYRKLKISGCSGGVVLDQGDSVYCGYGFFSFLWDLIKFVFYCFLALVAYVAWQKRDKILVKFGITSFGYRSVRLPDTENTSSSPVERVVAVAKGIAGVAVSLFVLAKERFQGFIRARRRFSSGYEPVGDVIYDFDDSRLMDLEEED